MMINNCDDQHRFNNFYIPAHDDDYVDYQLRFYLFLSLPNVYDYDDQHLFFKIIAAMMMIMMISLGFFLNPAHFYDYDDQHFFLKIIAAHDDDYDDLQRLVKNYIPAQ